MRLVDTTNQDYTIENQQYNKLRLNSIFIKNTAKIKNDCFSVTKNQNSFDFQQSLKQKTIQIFVGNQRIVSATIRNVYRKETHD